MCIIIIIIIYMFKYSLFALWMLQKYILNGVWMSLDYLVDFTTFYKFSLFICILANY